MHSNYSEVIPDHFIAKEKFLHLGMDMKLKCDGHQFGKIEQKLLSLGKSFSFYDKKGNLICKGKEKVFSLGVHLEIFDANDQKIGSVDKERFKSLMMIGEKYSVKDAYGNLLGETEQLQIFKTDIQIFDLQHNRIGSMKKGFFNLTGDKWQCNIYGPIDRRLLIFIPAFVSAKQDDADHLHDGI